MCGLRLKLPLQARRTMYIHSESRRSNLHTLNAISRLTTRAIHEGFNREKCLPTVQQLLNSSSSSVNDTSLFWKDSTGHIWSDYENPILQVSFCKAECGGGGMGWYPDAASRLLIWFIPVIFLMSSINLPPIGGKRFVMISHLFGDPIHSFWSLSSKLEDWNHCYAMAQMFHAPGPGSNDSPKMVMNILCSGWEFVRPLHTTSVDKGIRNTAVIIAAIRELLQPSGYDMNPNSLYLCSCIQYIAEDMSREVAGSIIDQRANGTLQTWFAIFTYIFGIVCAFVSVLGGSSSSPSGGKISPAMLLSWLLPIILLNNAIGQFRAEDCIRIVRQFEEHIKRIEHLESCTRNEDSAGQSRTTDAKDMDWGVFLDSQAWSGGVYFCQLKKPMLETGPRRLKSLLLIAVAAVPVCSSFGIAFGVLYSFPTFFSCRNIMIVGMMFVWLMSPFMTRIIMTNRVFGRDMKGRWRVLIWKDSSIGFSILFLLVASSCGLGNSCTCWAGFLNKVKGVVLNPDQQFTKNNAYIYPILILVCLFVQYIVFKTALYLGRNGLCIMKWSREDQRASLPARAAVHELEVFPSLLNSTSRQAIAVNDHGYELLEYRSDYY